MIDIVDIKKAVRIGELKVYSEGNYVYIENKAGERIALEPKGGEENAAD